jgi:3-phosphoshikimate 1-carboxyvinyltransferase
VSTSGRESPRFGPRPSCDLARLRITPKEDGAIATYPASIEIQPRGAFDALVPVPGSKSITNRALLVAALADGESELRGPLTSDDTAVMVEALHALGCEVALGAETWKVAGRAGRLRRSAAALYTANSGTTARFLTAAAALANGPVVIDGNPRMRERPIEDLVDALGALGVRVDILGKSGCPPLRVYGGGLPGGRATIDASRSSQYVSAVLLSAPYAKSDVVLDFRNGILVSRPYVELTLRLMRDFGAVADWTEQGGVWVSREHRYQGRSYAVEPDASSAAYAFCAAAIAGGRVRVEGIPANSVQADFALLGILEQMGCEVVRGQDYAEVRGPLGRLRGVDVDMNDLPDAAMAVAVVALFAGGDTRIRNVANLRIKESNRLLALETELRKLGASARTTVDSLLIEPGRLHAAEIDTYDDHRIAMAFALAGLRIPGVVIRNPACVSKTWPEYFSALERL